MKKINILLSKNICKKLENIKNKNRFINNLLTDVINNKKINKNKYLSLKELQEKEKFKNNFEIF